METEPAKLPLQEEQQHQQQEQEQHGSAYCLAKLPVEILDLICAQLCHHCRGLDGLLGDDDRDGRLALASLSATSRTLRDVAQPFLFHRLWHPRPFGADFIRTLLNRPDLAAAVKILDQSTCVPIRYPGKEDAEFIYDVAFELKLEIFDDPEFDKLEEFHYDDEEEQHIWHGIQEFERGKRPHDFDYLFPETLIALLPNLQSLAFSQTDYDASQHDVLARRFRRLGDRPGLPHLRTLKLQSTEGHLKLFHPANAVLMNAAPKLERLVISHCDQLKDSRGHRKMIHAMPNLRMIEFRDCELEHLFDQEAPYLRSLIEASPKLENFSYTHLPTGDHRLWNGPIPTASILACLEPSKQTLRHFEIDLSRQVKHMANLEEDEPGLGIQSLEGFSVLETVKLSNRSFCQCHLVNVPFFTRHDAHCLTKLLSPVSQSLKVLVVKVGRISRAWFDIASLGEQVAQGKFPALEHLEIRPTFTKRFGKLWQETQRMVEKQNQFVLASFKNTTVRVLLKSPEIVEFDED
ncbi:hypothetical protein PT974_02258 [Cladobotryum mycophilum]|uniref:F-box domain-containing protein n=1 Tax=Cladobotryum mycophilum TaxID=491253 RepID=A0ABR0SXK1_9HYPO